MVAEANFSPVVDFDTVLRAAGDFGRFQWKLVALLCFPFSFFLCFVYFGQIFATLEPEHWCHVPALVNAGIPLHTRRSLVSPLERRDDGVEEFSKCRMFDFDYEKIALNVSLAIPQNSSVIPCQHGWEYDTTDSYSTVVSEWDWVCEDNWRAPFAQSMFFVGAVVGSIVFGVASDSYGRVPSLVISNVVAAVAGVASAFSQGFASFIAFRFFVGFTFDTCFMLYYILVLEYVSPSRRTLVSSLALGVFFCFSTCVIPWIAKLIADWRLFMIVISAPSAVVILFWKIIPESARWQLSKGRVDEAAVTLERIAKINGMEIKSVQLDELQLAAKSETATSTDNFIKVFRLSVVRRRLLILFAVWFLMALAYDGHARNTHNLGYSVFYTFTIASATEFPAAILIVLLLDVIGRRWLSFLSLILGGVASLAYAAVPLGIYGAILAMIGRLFVNISMNIGLQYATELLPTSIRGQGMAIAHLLGFVANILSPFVVYLSQWNPALPLIVLGAVTIVAGILALFLPETMNENLPQTLEEGNKFGIDQPFFFLPWRKSKSEDTHL